MNLLLPLLLLAGLGARSATASVLCIVTEVGNNVVATASGSINFSALSLDGSPLENSFTNPGYNFGAILLIGASNTEVDEYGSVTGPFGFGANILSLASSSTGVPIGLEDNDVVVPHSYVSGTPLSGTATWDNRTLSSLGLTLGTYVYTWGSGATADSLTIEVETPEPRFTAGLGLLGLGLVWYRRRTAA